MLYERWREVARACADVIALRDLATNRHWTFAQLAAGAESARPPIAPERVSFPTGNSPEFIFTMLRAWRFGQVLCPLEIGSAPPALAMPPPEKNS